MSVSGHPVTTYYDGFPKAPPSLPPSTRRSGRGVVQRRTRVEYRRSRPTSSQRVVGSWGTQSLPAAYESLATRVLDPTLSIAERAGGVGGALGNPSSYVGTGVPATDRRAVGQTVRSGFPRPHPPHPPGGSAAIGSRSFELRHYGHVGRPAAGALRYYLRVSARIPTVVPALLLLTVALVGCGRGPAASAEEPKGKPAGAPPREVQAIP